MKNRIGMKRNLVGLTILLSGLTAACSSSNQWKMTAPTSAKETGVIVYGAKKLEIENYLSQHPEAQAREVSGQHNIYEIYSVSHKEIQRNFQQYEVYKNEFYPLKHREELTLQKLKTQIQLFNSNNANNSNPFASCVKAEETPSPSITIEFPKLELADGTMDLGGFFSLSATSSQAHPNYPSELKKTWIVIPPSESKSQASTVVGEQLNYKPDTVGSYQIGLVVQDTRSVCALSRGTIIVTHNPGYQGPTVSLDDFRAKHNLAAFRHLGELQAEESWNYSEGQGVLIAIIDTGVNYNHPALVHNIHLNGGEIANNGIDDDNNGYVDDSIGYDFANFDEDPYDDEGHGSHVAGLAASGVMGMARQARILPIKALSPLGGDPASIAAAVLYAVDRGAKVINMSLGGGSSPHPLMIKAMAYAEAQNVTVVAAAGNGDANGHPVNIDESPIYPAALTNSNIISVAAKDSVGVLAPYSNFGVVSVDVAAPGGGITQGDQIFSCTTYNPDGHLYVGLQGTSMAAPIVAGIAAQVYAIYPGLAPSQIRSILMSSGTSVESLKTLVGSGKYINAYQAVLRSAQLRMLTQNL